MTNAQVRALNAFGDGFGVVFSIVLQLNLNSAIPNPSSLYIRSLNVGSIGEVKPETLSV